MKGRICKKYDVEYGAEINISDYETFVKKIKKINKDLIIFELPYEALEINLDILLKRKEFCENTLDLKFLNAIFEDVKNNLEYLKKKGFIRIEWI